MTGARRALSGRPLAWHARGQGSLTVRAKQDHVAALNPHILRLKIDE